MYPTISGMGSGPKELVVSTRAARAQQSSGAIKAITRRLPNISSAATILATKTDAVITDGYMQQMP
jgi:hypothetical protein